MTSTGNQAQLENLQAAHYDGMAAHYSAHYGDRYSLDYRSRFLDRYLLQGLDLTNARVVEAMCGPGETTPSLLARGARVTGLDLSVECTELFRRKWPCPVVCASVLNTPFRDESCDVVVIVGGLHHVHPLCEQALDEIHRVLRPGGYLCFAEPHTGSIPDLFRRFWYRRDKLFASNEEAVDVDALERQFDGRFAVRAKTFHGNIAYLFVLNSMVFRLPHRWKGWFAAPLFWLEALLQPFQGRRLGCIAICQWQKHQP